MINCCPGKNVLYPYKADIYYPVMEQNRFGQVERDWIYDRTIDCFVMSPSTDTTKTEDVKQDIFINYKNLVISRTTEDIRVSSIGKNNAISDVLITNIRNEASELIYLETSGPRNNRGSIFEIATIEPFMGPFGRVEFYRMVWRRSENQAVVE